MNIQFFHQITPFNFERYTIAIATPNRNSFESLLSLSPVKREVNFLFGKAVCSNKDKYNKSVGRDLATDRMVSTTFHLDKVLFFDTYALYHFNNDLHDLVFRVHYNRNKVWLLRAQTKEPRKD